MTNKLKLEAEVLLKNAALEAKTLVSGAALEATKILEEAKKHVTNNEIMANDISYIRGDIKEIKEKLENKYVTIEQFLPVQRIVYGLIGVFGLAVLGAITKIILKV